MENIKLIILFGSEAKGLTHKNSDVDVAVLWNREMSLREKMEMEEWIAQKFNIAEAKLDLIDLWKAPPLLQKQIADKGKLLFGDEIDFIRFKVLAAKRYWDTAKFRAFREKQFAKIYG